MAQKNDPASKLESSLRAEEEARQYRFITDVFKDSVTLIGRNYIYQAANEAYCRAQGKKYEEIVGRSVRDLWGNEVFTNIIKIFLDRCFAGDQIHDEAWFEFANAGLRCIDINYHPFRDSHGNITHAVVISRDVTDQKNLEEEFRQVQKMQVIGRLVAGVSHDFNNILTVIVGYGEMLSRKLQNDPNRSDTVEILKAAERAKRLTAQLLAFSRRQTPESKALVLNELVEDMSKMIQRILGEQIEYTFQLKTDLWPVKGDPGHLEQVIMNLTVNARDAMSGKGKFKITTENVTIDQEFIKSHADFQTGDYVLLITTDSGCGMTDEVKARIFEPFFTTKGKGKGTGLGLATCYGIVKESGGHMVVDSQPGRGTSFKVYFPRTDTPQPLIPEVEDVLRAPRGSETILWVEDEAELRKFVSSTLRQLGYRVLEAADAQAALHLLQEHRDDKIDLFFGDVLLPMVSGKVLADRVKQDRPEMKMLFTSGYPDNVLNEHGVLKAGVELLRKPFWPAALAIKIRAVLDA